MVGIRRRYGDFGSNFEVAGICCIRLSLFVGRLGKNKMAGESPGTGDSQLMIRSGTRSSPAD